MNRISSSPSLIGPLVALFITGFTGSVFSQYATPAPAPAHSGQSVYQQPQTPNAQATQQPIRMQTMQTPPKTVLHNGVPMTPNGTNPNNERSMPAGFGSTYSGTVHVASTQQTPQISNAMPATNTAQTTAHMQQQPAPQQPTPQQPAHGAAQTTAQMNHMGRSAPSNRIVPFFLSPQEQQELDSVLARWEKYSEKIKRYDVEFTAYNYDPTVERPNPADVGKPLSATFGYFKYIAPNRFVFHEEGQWVNGVKTKRSEKNPRIEERKIIINEKSFFQYDYNSKTVYQINIPPELIGVGLADSPLPLIFGAKAEEMKKRFSMKIVTTDAYKESQIWIQARPLRIEDQQEFRQVEIRLDKTTLQTKAIKRDDINEKAHSVFVLSEPKINSQLDKIVEDLRGLFVPTVAKDWKHMVEDMRNLHAQAPAQAPAPAPATPSGNIAMPANPTGQTPPAQPRHEIPLYAPPQ